MKSAKLNSSQRLQRVLTVLSDGQEHSTLDIIGQAQVCAVSAIISELRANGVDIVCRRMGDRWLYKIGSRAYPQGACPSALGAEVSELMP